MPISAPPMASPKLYSPLFPFTCIFGHYILCKSIGRVGQNHIYLNVNFITLKSLGGVGGVNLTPPMVFPKRYFCREILKPCFL